jgi:hypothetical protein
MASTRVRLRRSNEFNRLFNWRGTFFVAGNRLPTTWPPFCQRERRLGLAFAAAPGTPVREIEAASHVDFSRLARVRLLSGEGGNMTFEDHPLLLIVLIVLTVEGWGLVRALFRGAMRRRRAGSRRGAEAGG